MSLGAEFDAQLDNDELRRLMARIGRRFADHCDVSQSTTIEAMQQCVNIFWADLDWGWVEMSGGDAVLEIRHLCSPLQVAFGESCSGWIPAFLEGVYQRWFELVGIDPALRVQQVGHASAGNQLVFKLSRAA